MGALRKISIIQTPLSLPGLSTLAEIPALRTLRLLRWQQVISDEFAAKLGSQTVVGTGAVPRGQALRRMSVLRQLQHLYVDHNLCSTDEELQELASNVIQLRELCIDLHRTSITPRALVALARRLPLLDTLKVGIEGAAFTPEDLKQAFTKVRIRLLIV